MATCSSVSACTSCCEKVPMEDSTKSVLESEGWKRSWYGVTQGMLSGLEYWFMRTSKMLTTSSAAKPCVCGTWPMPHVAMLWPLTSMSTMECVWAWNVCVGLRVRTSRSTSWPSLPPVASHERPQCMTAMSPSTSQWRTICPVSRFNCATLPPQPPT